MERYDFEVLKGDDIILAERSVGFADASEVWPRIAEIARKVETLGCRIRVTDQSGEPVVRIEIAAARISLKIVAVAAGPTAGGSPARVVATMRSGACAPEGSV